MSTFHRHNVRCPHCDNIAFTPGCSLDNCHFSESYPDPAKAPDGAKVDTCPVCEEIFAYFAGYEAEAFHPDWLADAEQSAADLRAELETQQDAIGRG